MKQKLTVCIENTYAQDPLSKVRGIGRYVSALQEALSHHDALTLLPPDQPVDIAIQPFFNPLADPRSLTPVPGRKSIAIVHDVIPLEFPRQFPVGIRGKIYKAINHQTIARYNHVVTDSQTSKKAIFAYFGMPDKQMSVIYPFSPLQQYAGHHNKNVALPAGVTKGGYVLYVGDVNWHKNITVMAQAAVMANTPLVCVGSAFQNPPTTHAWMREYRAFTAFAAEHPDLIKTLGYVSDDELVLLYQHACGNLLLSHDEGFGYSYVEAAACYTPSLLSDLPIFREISGGKGVVFVDQNDTLAVSHAITQLAQDAILRSQLGAQAHAQSLHYSRELFALDWYNLLTHL